MMNSTMKSDASSLDDGDLHVEISHSSGFKDDLSPNCDDELMDALDFLGEHVADSLLATRNSEMCWLQALQERDELIASKEQSIEHLQSLNEKLKLENCYLLQQLLSANDDDVTDEESEDNTTIAKAPTAESPSASQLKKQNFILSQQLAQSNSHYAKVLDSLQHGRSLSNGDISAARNQITLLAAGGCGAADQAKIERELSELCGLYERIIDGAISDCEQHMDTINGWEMASVDAMPLGVSLLNQHSSAVPNTTEYYLDAVQTLEKSNKELRQQVEQLQRRLSGKEQSMFNETMSRLDNSNKSQVDKLRAQIAELSQEMALQSVDNRALRERLLRTEGENEKLHMQLKDSGCVDAEMASLQENLDTQLGLNQSLEKRVKGLELVKMEHDSLCHRTKHELQEAKRRLMECETELAEKRKKLREAQDMQLKFDFMNLHLNAKMEKLHNENSCLSDNLSRAEKASVQTSATDAQKITDLESSIDNLENSKCQQQRRIEELTKKLDDSEKQRHNANLKVKALRERLKAMQDSWQKVSTDTESSFSALRDQYQQQIKEYKSIIESMKSQNTSLSARIESMRKVSDKQLSSQTNHKTNLEQQIAEYRQITEGYRKENALLRKELKALVVAKQTLENETLNSTTVSTQMSNSDDFAKLRDILTVAKSEVESLQVTKSPKSNASSFAESGGHSADNQRIKQHIRDIEERYERMSPGPANDIGTGKQVDSSRSWYSSSRRLSQQRPPLAESTPENRMSTAPNSRTSSGVSTAPSSRTPSGGSTAPSSGISSGVNADYRQDYTQPRIVSAGVGRKPYQPITPFTLSSSIRSDRAARDPSTYNRPANLRTKLLEEPTKLLSNGSVSKPLAVRATKSQSNSDSPPSVRKEVVEIKHYNSAELDLTKSFKPIEPDSGTKDSQPASQTSSKTAYPSQYKPSYSLPYKSSYSFSRGTSYASKYDSIKSSLHTHRSEPASSYGSKYPYSNGSTTRQTIGQLPESTKVKVSSAYARDPLPNISSLRAQRGTSSAPYDDPISKVPAVYKAQPARLVTSS